MDQYYKHGQHMNYTWFRPRIPKPSKYSGYLRKDCSAQAQVYCSLRGQSCSKRERLLKCTELATHHAQELAAKHICDPVLVFRWLIIPVGLNRIAVNYHILATPFAVLTHIQLGLGDTSILSIHTLPSIFNHQSIMVMSTSFSPYTTVHKTYQGLYCLTIPKAGRGWQ